MGKQAAAIGERLRKEVATAMKALALEIDKELRRNTPVDTGHARRNWVPSVVQPFAGVAADNTAHAIGVSEVLAYVLSTDPLWVANNVPYIRALNYGHSKQKPAGFVELAVDVAMQRVQAKFAGRIDLTEARSRFRSAVGGEGAENLASAYSPFGDDDD